MGGRALRSYCKTRNAEAEGGQAGGRAWLSRCAPTAQQVGSLYRWGLVLDVRRSSLHGEGVKAEQNVAPVACRSQRHGATRAVHVCHAARLPSA